MSKGNTENLYDVWTTVILIIQISLTITALLGFGLYLWYLKSSEDQSQSRMLNILNGYLSVTCIGLSLTVSAIYGSQLFKTKHDTFIAVEIGGAHIVAISSIFLLISWATILNHFKPGLYLDISVSWSHKVAIPSLIFAFILAEQSLYFSCTDKFCKIFRVRTFVMIPATFTSFLCQLLVIIDDIWGWRNIYRRLRGMCRQNVVSPDNNGNIDSTQGLDQHLVNFKLNVTLNTESHTFSKEFVSLTTGFIGFCVFNLIVFLISFIGTLLEDFDLNIPIISWQLAMAVTPSFWISRNKKIREKIKNLFNV